MRILAATAFAALVAAPALGQTTAASPSIVTHVRTTAELAAVCDPAWTGVSRLEAIAYCQGYLTGAGQYHASVRPAERGRPLYCVPSPGPSVAEAGVAFATWARQNPNRADEPALDGLLRWAQSAFPCPASRAPAPRAAR